MHPLKLAILFYKFALYEFIFRAYEVKTYPLFKLLYIEKLFPQVIFPILVVYYIKKPAGENGEENPCKITAQKEQGRFTIIFWHLLAQS